MFLSQFPVLLHQSVHTIDHLLDELHLRVSESVLVGDVVGDTWTVHGTEYDYDPEMYNLSVPQTLP